MLAFMEEEHHEALDTVTSFEDLARIAIEVLGKMKRAGHEIVQVCGPYTTGGLGSPELNGKRFGEARRAAEARGFIVFDQMPFEDAIKRITASYGLSQDAYCQDVLDVFYRNIFKSGHLSKFLFIPGWESSKGATWERKEAEVLGIPCEEIPLDWFETNT